MAAARCTAILQSSRPTRTGATTSCSTNTSTATTAPASAPATRPVGPAWLPRSSASSVVWIRGTCLTSARSARSRAPAHGDSQHRLQQVIDHLVQRYDGEREREQRQQRNERGSNDRLLVERH